MARRIAARMSDSELAAERPVRQRKSKAAKTDDERGEALAEELADDEWDDAAPERTTVQRVTLEDGTTATEIGTKERNEVDEEADPEDSEPDEQEESEQPVKAKRKRGKQPAKTNRTADTFTGQQVFFAEAQRQPFLTPEREQELGARVRKGDKTARDQLVQAHVRLIISMAREFEAKHHWARLDLEDLTSEGTIAATQAAKGFDPAKARFATHAAVWIGRAFQRHLDKMLDTGGEPRNRDDGDVEMVADDFLAIHGDEVVNEVHENDHESTDEWRCGFDFGRSDRRPCPGNASDDFRQGFAEGRQSSRSRH